MSAATSEVLDYPRISLRSSGYLLSQKLSVSHSGVQSNTVTAIPVIAGPV